MLTILLILVIIHYSIPKTIAIATHKYVIIFCVGLELYNAGISEKHYIYYMLVYSMMSPIGIAIGITVDVGLEHHHEEAYKSIVGLLQVSMIMCSLNISLYSSPIFNCY